MTGIPVTSRSAVFFLQVGTDISGTTRQTLRSLWGIPVTVTDNDPTAFDGRTLEEVRAFIDGVLVGKRAGRTERAGRTGWWSAR